MQIMKEPPLEGVLLPNNGQTKSSSQTSTTQTLSPSDHSPELIEEKRLHKETIAVVWKTISRSIPMFKTNGDVDSPAFLNWCKQTFQKHHTSDLITAANVISTTWTDRYAPSLPSFLSYVKNAKMAREINGQLHGRDREPLRIERSPEDKATRKAFLKRWAETAHSIAKTPTSREPSEGDLESFDESYKNLGLDRKWGEFLVKV